MCIMRVKAQHACTLCPTFLKRWTPLSHSNKLKLWIVSGAGLFFPPSPFFFTCISKQTEMELAVCHLHGAKQAAVSSHDPSLTQSD